MKARFVASFAVILGALWSCRAQVMPPQYAPQTPPRADAIWTSTREIRDLQIPFYGRGVWAATAGGVLRFDGKKWRKWTRRDGLPSHEALEIGERLHQPFARFPTATAMFSSGKWQSHRSPVFEKKPQEFFWNGQTVRVLLDGLQLDEKVVGLPKESNGTHLSAILNVGKSLLIAIYGDGLWHFDGANWIRFVPALPRNGREITALARDGRNVWIGTRRDGIFRLQNGKWRQFLEASEPASHNVQFFAEFGGVLWASTLDDGLICRAKNGWNHVSAPTLSSTAPRQMLVWKDRLWVRHGGGLVDSFDGRNWTKNVLQSIPRQGVYALAGEGKTLFAAGWGGWSEWNGSKWTPHFKIAELQGVPLMGLLPDGEWLWIATQSRGLGRYSRKSGSFRWFDERDGLGDDWITSLAKTGGKIYAGTFVGGLARLDGEKWHVFETTRGQNVTAIQADGQGGVWAATRNGVWKIEGDTATKIEKSWLDSEVQALYRGKNGMWVGTRTSLNFLAGN